MRLTSALKASRCACNKSSWVIVPARYRSRACAEAWAAAACPARAEPLRAIAATTVFHSRWMASPAVSRARSSRARAASTAASCAWMSPMFVRSKDQVATNPAVYNQLCPLNPAALVPRSTATPLMVGTSTSRCALASFSAASELAAAAWTAGRPLSAISKAARSGSGCRSSVRAITSARSGSTPDVDWSARAARET